MAAVMVVALVAEYLHRDAGYVEVLFWIEMMAGVALVVTVVIALPRAVVEIETSHRSEVQAWEARERMSRLFRMTDMLQSALDHADANAVLRATAEGLLPGFGCALYIFNNSHDRLDLSTYWQWPRGDTPPEAVAPSQCWALKRGKAHVNGSGEGALRCEHLGEHPGAQADVTILEIPMMARGEVYGLLAVSASGADAQARLADIDTLAEAIADAMSLALSNIALREKLRTQALRDPLTGLYNRRYMEDVLERYANLAARSGQAVSAIMIDLDHFKRLNDEHGHAQGDAVLRAVAASIVGALRQSDVACRYGGEELVVLLPDCPLAEAVAKAEVLRLRIEALSEVHGVKISASFGVATIPETTVQVSDILGMADAALYQAKQAGRNRVIAASRRAHLAAVAE
jgi:diguanylate cyclase (GGDEF)-like protein